MKKFLKKIKNIFGKNINQEKSFFQYHSIYLPNVTGDELKEIIELGFRKKFHKKIDKESLKVF